MNKFKAILEQSTDPFKLGLRRSKREQRETNLSHDFYTFLVNDESRSYKQAMTCPDASLWKEATNSEIESVMNNHILDIVCLPPMLKLQVVNGYFKRN